MDYNFLLDLAIVLITTKLLGLFTKRIAMPQVVGALLAGLLLGPALLGLLHETTLMDQLSELGVIVLMFNAGLGTDIGELKKSGGPALLIATIGVLVPLGGGFLVAHFFNSDPNAMLQNVFIGVILTATSVSITVETLKEIGKLSTKSGNAILGAALIDDVLGIVALTLITSLADKSVNIGMVLLRIAAFFVFSLIAGFLLHKAAAYWFKRDEMKKRRFVIIAFACCLIFAFVAEVGFGVADITGAYIAGLIFARTPKAPYLQHRFDILSYMLLSPVFFASIGLKVKLPEMSASIVIFSILLIVVAVLSKVIGCGVGAKICRYSSKDAIRIGVGMISRGEVALIVANNGMRVGLMNQDFFGPVVIMVVVTTIVTPILLKVVYKSKPVDANDVVDSALIENIRNREEYDRAQRILDDQAEQRKRAVSTKQKNKKKQA